MKYLAIPLLIFNFLFLTFCDDFTKDMGKTAEVKDQPLKKVDSFNVPLLSPEKKDSIQTNEFFLKK